MWTFRVWSRSLVPPSSLLEAVVTLAEHRGQTPGTNAQKLRRRSTLFDASSLRSSQSTLSLGILGFQMSNAFNLINEDVASCRYIPMPCQGVECPQGTNRKSTIEKNGPEPTIKVIRGLENCFPTPLIMRLQPVVAESLLVRARGTIPETMRLLNILIRSR